MATNILTLLGLGGPKLLPSIGAAAPAMKQPPADALVQARTAAQAPSVLPKVGAVMAQPADISPDAMMDMGGAPALLPAVGAPMVTSGPQVTNPLRQATIAAQDQWNKDSTPLTPWSGLSGGGKAERILGMIVPGAMARIPGTETYRQAHLGQDMGALEKLSGLENQAQTQARGEEEVGLRRQQLEDAENKQPANPWAEMRDYFGPNGEPVERHTMTGEIRMVPLPAGVTRVQAVQKEGTPQQQAFDAYIKSGMTAEQAYEKIREKPAVPEGATKPGGGADNTLVDMIGTGHMPVGRMSYLLARNPALLEEVSKAYPDFDASKVESYANTYKDFTSGKTSVMLNSGGTALTHLLELKGLNTDASHFPGTPDWNAYQNKADTVATELARFYGDTTIPAIEQIKKTLAANLPGTRDRAIQTQAQSMGDKINSFEKQWQNAAPSKAYEAPMPGLSADAYSALARLRPGGGEGGFQVRLSDAMGLPQNKGKSEAEVRKDVEAHGGTVVQ